MIITINFKYQAGASKPVSNKANVLAHKLLIFCRSFLNTHNLAQKSLSFCQPIMSLAQMSFVATPSVP